MSGIERLEANRGPPNACQIEHKPFHNQQQNLNPQLYLSPVFPSEVSINKHIVVQAWKSASITPLISQIANEIIVPQPSDTSKVVFSFKKDDPRHLLRLLIQHIPEFALRQHFLNQINSLSTEMNAEIALKANKLCNIILVPVRRVFCIMSLLEIKLLKLDTSVEGSLIFLFRNNANVKIEEAFYNALCIISEVTSEELRDFFSQKLHRMSFPPRHYFDLFYRISSSIPIAFDKLIHNILLISAGCSQRCKVILEFLNLLQDILDYSSDNQQAAHSILSCFNFYLTIVDRNRSRQFIDALRGCPEFLKPQILKIALYLILDVDEMYFLADSLVNDFLLGNSPKLIQALYYVVQHLKEIQNGYLRAHIIRATASLWIIGARSDISKEVIALFKLIDDPENNQKIHTVLHAIKAHSDKPSERQVLLQRLIYSLEEIKAKHPNDFKKQCKVHLNDLEEQSLYQSREMIFSLKALKLSPEMAPIRDANNSDDLTGLIITEEEQVSSERLS